MKKHKHLILALVLLACIGILFLIRVSIRKPVEWTRSNSLFRIPAPVFLDRKEEAPLIRAIDQSLRYLETRDPASRVFLGPDDYPLDALRQSLTEFRDQLIRLGLGDDFFRYVREHFLWYRTPAKQVLFTGYYEASLRGSRERSDTFRYPLYRTPSDLVKIDLSAFYFYPGHRGLPSVLRGRVGSRNTIIPYFSREEIDAGGKLSGRNLELAWADDPLEVFFLHIQGSGVITLPDGTAIRINYADSNGHPYRAIGKLLIDRGVLDAKTLSLQRIRQYLEQHPEEIRGVLNYNPSYVFFREVSEGPLGSLGVPLTAYRSIATDSRLFPAGALCYVETEIPVFDKSGTPTGERQVTWKPFSGFVLNQDTGGAIRGAGRVDLFTGFGEEGVWVAGHMKQPGTFYFLIRKNPAGNPPVPDE